MQDSLQKEAINRMPDGWIDSMYRYPVKGLSPEPVAEVRLKQGGYFPCDRIFAVENGPSGYDAGQPAFRPKTKFLMLMKNERLARLRTRYDETAGVLHVARDGRPGQAFELHTSEGRSALEDFLADYCADELRGPPRVLAATGGFRFTDSSRSGFVSLLNLASVAELGAHMEKVLDPLRFRANLHVTGWDAWREMDLIGRTIVIGSVRLEVLKTIDRCLATHVDPQTGERDADVVGALRRDYGHIECGIYARIRAPGRIAAGDSLEILD